MRLSIVIPTLNAAPVLPGTLRALMAPLDAATQARIEVVIADGGSTDATVELARGAGAVVLQAPRGRGNQLAAGARAACGDWLLFLHADTSPGPDWDQQVESFVRHPGNAMRAGHFRFRLASAAPQARTLEGRVAWRSRVLGLPYGDQGLLISRALYDRVGGYRPIPLMEDVDLVRRIGRRRLAAIPVDFVTDASKFTGRWRCRSLRNIALLVLYFAGVPPRFLAKIY